MCVCCGCQQGVFVQVQKHSVFAYLDSVKLCLKCDYVTIASELINTGGNYLKAPEKVLSVL